jgi:hypothetical protein
MEDRLIFKIRTPSIFKNPEPDPPSSIADPGCLSLIPDPDFCPSRIQKQQQKRWVKNHKIEEKKFRKGDEKYLGKLTENYRIFYPKNCH